MLGLVPLLGLLELGLHQYFARRAPGFEDYAALAPQLSKLKPAGVPVVAAPAWIEPLLRQAAPKAFPLEELARMDDAAFEGFLEVSALGEHAPELAAYPVERRVNVGRFELSLYRNPRHQTTLFDFVTAVAAAEVEVFSDNEGERRDCSLVAHGRASTGGLHGHVAYPRQRFECPGGGFVGVSLVEDETYRPRRCILVQAPRGARLVLRFGGLAKGRKLFGFAGLSYFLERDAVEPSVELRAASSGVELGEKQVRGADGWSHLELAAPPDSSEIELSVRDLTSGPHDVCFALEAR